MVGVNNYKMLTKMSFDRKVIKSLFEIYNILKEDKNFNINKYIKMMSSMLKGEKLIEFEDKYIISAFLPPFPSKAFYTNLMAVPESNNIFTQQIYGKRSGPISFYLSLTNKCPNNCLYCSTKNRVDDRELTTREWIDIISNIQDMNTSIIGLTGGEPMVREDIYQIVESIDDRSVSTLFTSGFNLTLERAKELKKRGLFSIGISLDSYDRKRHNANRNSEQAFDYAIRAIQNSRSAGIYTMAQTVILKEELDEEKLLNFFKFAGEIGVHEVKILEPILSGSLLGVEDLDKVLFSIEDRKKLINIQHKANRKGGLPKITTFAYTESKERYGCGAGTQHSYISASGHLYPCDFVPMSFGSIGEKGIEELWKEMNEIMGKPKIGCFAQRVNKEVYKKANKELPLVKEESIKICENNMTNEFPQYYKELQK
jgi:MoaA/NifB/PqqE/SkfB family radical SAM enzyme